jgi:hypothetical protein
MKNVMSATVTVSTAILTAGFLLLVPRSLNYVSTWREPFIRYSDSLRISNYMAPMGFASLTVIAMSVMVLWTAYRDKERWAWWVLLVSVVGFIFPVYVLQLIILWKAASAFSPSEWLKEAIRIPGPSRIAAEQILLFIVMLLALLLPVRTFFRARTYDQRPPTTHA